MSLLQWPKSLLQWPNSPLQWPNSLIQWPISLLQWPRSLIQWPMSLLLWPTSLIQWPISLLQWPISLLQWPISLLQWPISRLQWPMSLLYGDQRASYTVAQECITMAHGACCSGLRELVAAQKAISGDLWQLLQPPTGYLFPATVNTSALQRARGRCITPRDADSRDATVLYRFSKDHFLYSVTRRTTHGVLFAFEARTHARTQARTHARRHTRTHAHTHTHTHTLVPKSTGTTRRHIA